MYGASDLHFFDHLPISLVSNLINELGDKAVLDLRMQHNVVLELTSLHLFNWLKFDLGHVVLIHIQ